MRCTPMSCSWWGACSAGHIIWCGCWTTDLGAAGGAAWRRPLIHVNTFTQESIRAMGREAGLRTVAWPLRWDYSLIDATACRTLVKSLLRPLYRRGLRTTYVLLQTDT